MIRTAHGHGVIYSFLRLFSPPIPSNAPLSQSLIKTMSALRKSPQELLIQASATPLPSTVSTDSEVFDLTAVDVGGVTTLIFTGVSLSCIWDDGHIQPCIVEGKKGWKCKWCGKFFNTRHSVRAL